MGPNDTSDVVWAIGELFFTFSFVFFLILTKVLLCI